MHISDYSGDGGDSLTNSSLNPVFNINGMKFSTIDSDNDLSTPPSYSCAQEKGRPMDMIFEL